MDWPKPHTLVSQQGCLLMTGPIIPDIRRIGKPSLAFSPILATGARMALVRTATFCLGIEMIP